MARPSLAEWTSVHQPLISSEDSSQMGVNMILRDDVEGFVACRTLVVDGTWRVDEGEAIGLYEALSWIKGL
ncbi:hypothetical protein ACS0TY_015501 [Phlomoides rotata]